MCEEKYILSDSMPHCVHTLGADPKAGGGFRPITNCKRPLGSSINIYMSETVATFTYNSVDVVSNILMPRGHIATVDIASAYRSISIHPDNWKLQGVSWKVGDNTVPLMDLFWLT